MRQSMNFRVTTIPSMTNSEPALHPRKRWFQQSMIIAMVLAASWGATARSLLAGAIYFDSLSNWTLVTDQYRSRGAVFNSARVHKVGTNGVDGAASTTSSRHRGHSQRTVEILPTSYRPIGRSCKP